MNPIFALDVYYLTYFFLAVFAASFALPSGSIIIIVSFASVVAGWEDAALLIFLSLAASILGDYYAYLTFRRFRGKINPMLENIVWAKDKVIRVENLFDKYGTLTVFLTRFLFSGIGPYVNFFSGLRNMPRWGFLKAVIAGELIFCFSYLAIGYFFRDAWQGVMTIVQEYTIFSVLSLVGALVVYRMVKLIIAKNGNGNGHGK